MKTLAWIFATLLLVLSLILVLPFSATGTRFLFDTVNRSQIVQIEYAGGSLFGDLALSRLGLEIGVVDLRLDGVNTRLQVDCFWRSAFCLDELRVESLSLDISISDDNPGDEPARDRAFLEIPYAYEVSTLTINRARVTWPGGSWSQGEARGQLSLRSSELTIVGASITRPRLEVIATEQAEAGYAGFAPPEIFMPMPLAVKDLSLQEASMQAGEFEQGLERVSLSGRWQGHDLDVDTLELSAPDYDEIALHGSLQFAKAWPAKLTGEIAFSDDIGLSELSGRELSLEASGDLTALAVRAESPGKPQLDLSIAADLTSAGIPHQGGMSLTWPESTSVGEVLGQTGNLQALAITSPLQVQMQGSLEQQVLKASLQVAGLGYEALEIDTELGVQFPQIVLRSLRIEDAASESQLMASGTIELAEGAFLQAELESSGFALPSSAPGRVGGAARIGIEFRDESWLLSWHDLDLEGIVNGLPASARGSAGLDSRLRLLPGTTEVMLNGASLYASVPKNGADSADLSLQLDDLGRWVAGARGSLSLSGQGSVGRQRIALNGNAHGIKMSGIAIDEATLSLAYSAKDESLKGHVSVPVMESADYALRDLSLNLDGSLEEHRLTLASRGDVTGSLILQGGWTDDQWKGSLNPAQLDTSSGTWTLPQAVAMAWSPESALTLADHCWQHPEFTLCGEKLVLGNQGGLHLDLNGNVRAFNGLLPGGLRLSGAVASTLDAAWAPSKPLTLNASLEAEKLRAVRHYGMGERVSVTWDLVELEAQYRNEGLKTRGRVVREGRQVIVLDALLPTAPDQPMQGSVEFQGLRLATLSPWLTELSDLEGTLTGNLLLGGTPADPQARGELQLADAEIALIGNPTKLTELVLDMTLEGDRARYSGSGLLGGGLVKVHGQVLAVPALRVELTVSGREHEILLPPASSVVVSEDLDLVVTEGLLEVRGEVRVHEGLLRHEELPAGSVGLSPEIVVVDTLGNVIKEERPFEVRADVQVRIRDRFKVEGDGLRATLGGDLHVVQTPGETAQVFGNLSVVSGELEAYHQRLIISRGLVSFTGAADNPGLDIVAEREIRDDNVTVGARLHGSVEEPVLEVFSDPVMPQGEAMSYLIRGRGLDAGAGADGTALALSMGASVVNQSGIVDELNSIPLISDVSFGASGSEEDTAATVSGYIGNRLYLSYGRGLYEPINELTARLYFQSRLWLEVVSRLENSADLYYSFDIN